jgi:hypothetical protein
MRLDVVIARIIGGLIWIQGGSLPERPISRSKFVPLEKECLIEVMMHPASRHKDALGILADGE